MLGVGPTSRHPIWLNHRPTPHASKMTGVKGIISQARRHAIGEKERVESSSWRSKMREVQAASFLDVPFHRSERADSTARISSCLVLPFAPIKGAEPSRIGATVGRAVYAQSILAIRSGK